MNNIEQSLTSAITKAVNDVYGMEPQAGLVMVEIPKDTANGDYSTNIAMRLPKLVHKAPQEIAKAIVEKLEQSLDNVDKIEIAGPGFINFRMKKTAIPALSTQCWKRAQSMARTIPASAKACWWNMFPRTPRATCTWATRAAQCGATACAA